MLEGDKICKHCGIKKIDHIYALGADKFVCPLTSFEEQETEMDKPDE